MEIDREQYQVALAEVLKLAGHLHPIARKPLVAEARRLWVAAGISEPIPSIQESSRRREIRERLAGAQ